MSCLTKREHRSKQIILEKIDTEEIKQIAKEQGCFNSECGIYYILTTEENNTPFKDAMKTPDYATMFIGQGGIIKNTLKDPNTDKEIFSWADYAT